MTSKEKYITETYGSLWDKLNETSKKCALKNDGWISSILEHRPQDIQTDYSMDKKAWRIMDLTNFEDNNGWFKTEDGIFPEDEIPVLWLNFENGEYELASLLHVDFKHTDYTHWTPINLKSPVW
jgi:hypothetical protein